MKQKSVYVKFTNGTEGKYTFAGDLKSWEKHFTDIWRAAGHKVEVR